MHRRKLFGLAETKGLNEGLIGKWTQRKRNVPVGRRVRGLLGGVLSKAMRKHLGSAC